MSCRRCRDEVTYQAQVKMRLSSMTVPQPSADLLTRLSVLAQEPEQGRAEESATGPWSSVRLKPGWGRYLITSSLVMAGGVLLIAALNGSGTQRVVPPMGELVRDILAPANQAGDPTR